MKNTRESMNKAVEEIRKTRGFNGDNVAVLREEIGRLYGIFQSIVADGATDEEITAAAAPVKNAIGLFNDEMRLERLEQLEEMAFKNAIADYMRNQCVKGLAFKKEKGEQVLSVQDCDTVELEAYDVVETLFNVGKGGVYDACCIFADNLVKFTLKDDGATAVNRKVLSKNYMDLRKRMGWEIDVKKAGKKVLAKQLTEIVGMICRGLDITMQNCDVTYLQQSIINGKTTANEAGIFVKRDEKTVVNYVFRAAYTRYNKLPYQWQDNGRTDKDPMTVSANKDMGEKTEKAEKPEVVFESKVEVVEK